MPGQKGSLALLHDKERAVMPARRLWRIVRFVREEFEVEAATRAEALEGIQDPHSVTVTKETCTLKDA